MAPMMELLRPRITVVGGGDDKMIIIVVVFLLCFGWCSHGVINA